MPVSGAELFSTSWTVHRVSPLYHSNETAENTLFDAPGSLRVYANRLRDTLTGNVLGGIVQLATTVDDITVLDNAIAKAGPLHDCRWEILPTWGYWNEEYSILEDPDQDDPLIIPAEHSAGIFISLDYQHAKYKAALLAGPDGYHSPIDGEQGGTTYLPLLITRMPNALRQSLVSFLSENFDVRVSLLRLPSSFLCASLEGYLAMLNQLAIRTQRSTIRRASSTSITTIESRAFVESIVKEVQLTLSFQPSIAAQLKSLVVSLPRESLNAFYISGLSSSNNIKGSNSSSTARDKPTAPFLTALAQYFDQHLAMKLDQTDFTAEASSPASEKKPPIRLTKVSCGAFVLGSEGRVKFLANPGRTITVDDSDTDDGAGGENLDIDETQKRLVWKANEQLLRALIARSIGGQQEQNGGHTNTTS
ncbi:hypothetical protein FQN57_005751 [Myotisia sp. PD_48]|nr:hypothetical protein FQN57_005751 [Myotisia sp. PD_48]